MKHEKLENIFTQKFLRKYKADGNMNKNYIYRNHIC